MTIKRQLAKVGARKLTTRASSKLQGARVAPLGRSVVTGGIDKMSAGYCDNWYLKNDGWGNCKKDFGARINVAKKFRSM